MAHVRRKPTVLVGAVLCAWMVPLISGNAAADATYAATAEATAVKIVLTNQSIPLGVAPQLQGPTAVAAQNSLQQSDAYAAFPFPGEEVAGVPGVVGGVAGVPLPAYPFVVSTSFGDGPRQLSYPGIELRSESGDTRTQATATGGSTGVGATSTARIVREGDAVTAAASTDADALRLGDALVLSGLRAAATAARDSAGTLTRTSELSFSGLTAPGLAFTLPAQPGATEGMRIEAPRIALADGQFTVTAPGTPTQEYEVPAAAVADAFTQAGYPTTFQAARETENGIVGAGLQVTLTLPAPPPGAAPGFSGETPVTYSIGLTSAEVAYTALPDAPAVPAAAPGNVPAPAVTDDLASGLVPAPLPAAAPAGPGAIPQFLPGEVPGGVPPAPGLVVPTVDLASLQATRAAIGSDVGWIYLMVAAVGAAAFGGTVVLRYRGVR